MLRTSKPLLPRPLSISYATVMMLGVVAIALALSFAWFTGEGQISRIFAQLNLLQQSPPMWLEAPMVAGHYLIFPTVALFLCAVAITRISPQPKPWSRTLVISSSRAFRSVIDFSVDASSSAALRKRCR